MKPEREGQLILAGLAHNALQLLDQYNEITPSLAPQRRYDVTLHLSVLQLLITNGLEHYRTLSDAEAREWLRPLAEVLAPTLRAVERVLEFDDVTNLGNMHDVHSFPEEFSALSLLTQLRNALSHPRARLTNNPTTGYLTEANLRREITHVVFMTSPDYNGKGTPKAPKDRPMWNNKPYEGPVRVFRLRMTVPSVIELTRALASRLSEGVSETLLGEFATSRVDELDRAS